MTRRFIYIFFIILVFIAAMPYSAGAKDLTVDARVDQTRLPLGETVQFEITVSGRQDVSPFKLPELDGFDIQYLGPSRSVSIVNGNYSSSVTFNYSLLPTKEGELVIPSLEVTIDNQAYRTDAIRITVGAQDGEEGEANSLKDQIFLQVKVSKEEAYINEPVLLKVFYFYTGVSISDIQYPAFDNVGFIEEEYNQPKQYQQNIEGRLFNVVEFSKIIYPTRTGELKLGPAKLGSSLVVQKSNSRRSSVFDDPFFSSFFGRQEKRSMTITSNTVELTILDLPKEGRPKHFSGAVGQYDFDAELGPTTEVKVGDPLTLRLKISGEGNMQSVQFPKVTREEDFKLYDPNITEKNNVKMFEQVLIPVSENVTELEELRFSYFDPEAKEYKTISKGPIALVVEAAEEGEGLTVVGLDRPLNLLQPESIGQDIIFIKDNPSKFYPKGKRIFHRFLYWFLVFSIAVLFAVSYLFYRRTHRLETDSVYARAQKAPKVAQDGLAEAENYLSGNNGQAFYDAVFKTLQAYLGHKFALPAGTITIENIEEKIGQQKYKESLIKVLDHLFKECETVRYASGSLPKEQMQETLDRLQKCIQVMEQNIS